ncbi:MAG: phosphate transporter, periplasmic phosphate-binding protein [Paenibacillaceae bacterium]|nr:phosphate transporter, periplasmic phosphate-binding protein [Paenibacillaceae bacterium]
MLRKFGKFSAVTALAAVLTVTAIGCGNAGNPSASGNAASGQANTNSGGSASKKEITLTGAGSTFVNPLFSKMFSEYNKLHPEIKVNFQSIGSGAGIQQLTQGTVDFGASDAFMDDNQIAAVKNGVVQIPVTVGAEAIIYNIDGVQKGLKLTQETLSNIYLGKITKWNDPKIVADNAGVKLPDLAITPIYRSDGSGTTAIFTDSMKELRVK